PSQQDPLVQEDEQSLAGLHTDESAPSAETLVQAGTTDRSVHCRWNSDAKADARPTFFTNRQRSAEFLGETDEKSFGPPDVAEPIRVFVLDHFADELRPALAEPDQRIVDVLHGEHDA